MDQSKLSIGITGSHGFIGSHLAKALKKSGKYDLTLLDHKHNDLLDEKSLKSFVSGRDVIFHIAGANRDTNVNLLRINVLGTLNLLEAIKNYNDKKIKFIFISSIQVYTPSFNDSALREEDLSPFSDTIFGLSKITAEKLVNFYDIDSIIFRLSNVYGPYSKPFYNSVIATFCYLIANGKTIQINGDGEQKRDFIFISDVVDALMKVIGYSGGEKEIFNLGSGELTSLRQIISIIKKLSGIDNKVEYISSRRESTGWVLTNLEKITSKLNWGPRVDIEKGLKETYLYFQNCKEAL